MLTTLNRSRSCSKSRRTWLRRCVQGMVLLCCGGAFQVHAQQIHIPDSVSLTDARFFRDKEAGRLYNQALKINIEDSGPLLALLNQAHTHARRHQDVDAQAIICTEIASLHLRAGEVVAAFDWVNNALTLDSLMAPLSPLRQRCHRNIAGFYTDFEAHGLALGHYRTALAIDEARDPLSTPRRYRHCASLAICFERLGVLDSARRCHQRAIDIATELHLPMYESAAYNNYGMFLQAQGKIAEALQTYERAYAILAPKSADELKFALSVRDNMGEAQLGLGQILAARASFRTNYADYARHPDAGMHVQAGINLVRTELAANELGLARRLLDSIADFFQGSPPVVLRKYRKPLLLTQIQLNQAEGHWQAASALQLRLQALEDSLRAATLDRKVGTLASMLADKTSLFRAQLDLSEAAAASARSRARTQIFLLVSIAAVAILLLLVWLLSYRRRMERVAAQHAQERLERELIALNLQNQELQNAQLSQQLVLKQRDITDYALIYSQRRKVMEELLEELKEIRRAPQPDKGLTQLIGSIKAKLDGEGKLHLESRHIDTVNHAFFDALKQRFPGLAPGELELCGMIRLGYNAKEIAAMRNIAPGSVRIAKTRLKKKMGLGVEDDLEEFLEKIG
jgi:tetratricopeptide (TPR) repeat protein